MGEWKEYKLNEIASYTTGKLNSNAEVENGVYPFFTCSPITLNIDHFAFDTEALILAGNNANGIFSLKYYNGKFNAYQRTYIITIKDLSIVTYKFLYHALKTQLSNLEVISHGTATKYLTLSIINQISIQIPPLPEQKAIASVLSSLDDKIDLLHRQNKTLEAMAETLFRQWFVEEAQEDWEEKKFGELLDITSSKRIFYKEYVSFGVPFYRGKEIIELHNTGITNSELYISENRYDEIAEKFGAPVEGDILLTSVGTLGVPYRVKKNDKFYFKDGNLTWFKNFRGIPGILIYFWLKSNIGKEQLDAITIGSTQPALTIIGLKKVRLIIPPPDKLKEIEGYLGYIYNKIDSNHSQIRTLEKLRDTLLPKLMSGEVRVRV